jgi:hypothetical protein
MALVTIRNPEMAHNRTVVAKVALKNGMVAKLVQGTAKGEPCQVDKFASADLSDASIVKGIVTFVPDNDLTVDFILNPANEALTLNTGADDNSTDIAAGSLCVFWYNKPLVGYHSSMVDASLVFSTAREGDKIAVKETTAIVGAYNSGDTSLDVAVGTIYEHEGAEVTILFQAF